MKFIPWENPMGTDGFEFIEYAAPEPAAMARVFEEPLSGTHVKGHRKLRARFRNPGVTHKKKRARFRS
jgi:4-hydroxyphenylpyruvate dioxygenase-like putative hemolysin